MEFKKSAIQKDSQLSCPHCKAGEDGFSIGLFWDLNEKAWRCISCGHRSYEIKPRTRAQQLEDLAWDRVLNSLEPLETEEVLEEDFELETLEVI